MTAADIIRRQAQVDREMYDLLETAGLLRPDGQEWHASSYVRLVNRHLPAAARRRFLECASVHSRLAKLLLGRSIKKRARNTPRQLTLFGKS